MFRNGLIKRMMIHIFILCGVTGKILHTQNHQHGVRFGYIQAFTTPKSTNLDSVEIQGYRNDSDRNNNKKIWQEKYGVISHTLLVKDLANFANHGCFVRHPRVAKGYNHPWLQPSLTTPPTLKAMSTSLSLRCIHV